MSIALRTGQTASAQNAASAASIAVSFPSTVNAGNLITVKVSCSDQQSVSTVVMTGETIQAGIQLDDTTNGQRIEGWYAFNTAGGQTQVTANFNVATTFRAIAIAEWTGAQTSPDPKDKTASALQGGTAAAATSGTDQTPTVNGELIWGAVESNSTVAATANSPYTLLESETTVNTGSEYQIQATAAAVHANFNTQGSTIWGVAMMTFKPAAGAAAQPYDLEHSSGFQSFLST